MEAIRLGDSLSVMIPLLPSSLAKCAFCYYMAAYLVDVDVFWCLLGERACFGCYPSSGMTGWGGISVISFIIPRARASSSCWYTLLIGSFGLWKVYSTLFSPSIWLGGCVTWQAALAVPGISSWLSSLFRRVRSRCEAVAFYCWSLKMSPWLNWLD